MTSSSVQEQKYIAMTNGSVELLVCKMALPTMVIMMISAIYNMADTYFVGKIGTSATAGVAIVFSLMGVIQATGFFFGHGSGSYISRKLGEKNIDEAEYMAATGVFLSFLFGLLFSFIGLWNLEPLAILLGATDTILPYAKDYMRFILLAMPFMSSSLTMNNQLRLQGSAFYGMIGMISGAILNFILDPILIFWFDMGVAGAGLATMISQLFSFSILFIACSQEGNIRIHIDNFRPRIKYFTEIFRGGFPSLCRQALGSISILALNHSAGIYGDAAIAAMSIASRSANLSFSILIGFGQGFQPVCGFNYGAKLYAR
ncbi:MAG: MATE family efflux transporter, partial [Pusillimonas sp.]